MSDVNEGNVANSRFIELRMWNFRAFRWSVLPLSDLAVLIGPNGSGKSTVARALRVMSLGLTRSLEEALEGADGAYSLVSAPVETDPAPIGLALKLRHRQVEWVYGFILEASREEYHVELEGLYPQEAPTAVGFQRDRDGGVRLVSDGHLASKLSPEGEISRLHAPTLAFPLVAARSPVWPEILEFLRGINTYRIEPARVSRLQPVGSLEAPLREDGSNAADVLYNLRSAPQRAWIREHLGHTTPGLEDALAVTSEGFRTLRFQQRLNGTVEQFSGHQMSDGTLHMLGLLLALRQEPRPSLVFLDEIEDSLYPPALDVLFEAILDCLDRTQVLVSSHSIQALSHSAVTSERVRLLSWAMGTSSVHFLHPNLEAVLKPPETVGGLLSVNALRADETAQAIATDGGRDRGRIFLGAE